MKRNLVSAVAIAAAMVMGGVAEAADIRQPPPAVKAPAYVEPLFTWTGFYIGGNIGYGWSDGSGTVTNTGFFPAAIGARGPVSGDGDGILGGVQIGYNWQSGAFVYGIETDFQFSGGEGDFRGRVAPGAANRFAGTAKNEWFGTIRGRLGYAVDTWLVYVTGGGAYTHNKIDGVTGTGVPFSASETGWTWTVGGGVEAALWANWSVKAEYLYLATPDSVPTPVGTSIDGDVDTHVIRVGVNYRF
ncbi:MAG: outer membrane beta-barrel protein [Rhizobiales bacterium]|nr:outer membrane beta-barrel protein [Hyphomicrobiales bacterium]